MAEFVGASRGLRRLAVTPIERDDLEPLSGRRVHESVELSSSLEDALATMMRCDDGVVGVTENGDTVGVLTPDAVHRALRRSVAGTD